MKVFLSRVSTDEQSELRQIQNVEGFDKVIIDKCSGLVPLWERPNIIKNKIKKLVDNGTVKHIEVHSIDRLGRDTLSVLSVWKELISFMIYIKKQIITLHLKRKEKRKKEEG